MAINLITTWAEFVVVFLKKFFPMHKAARIQNELANFVNMTKNHSGDTYKGLRTF